MKPQVASIGFLLVCGAWNTQKSLAAPTGAGSQPDTLAVGTEGAMYEHSLKKSRFDVGAGAHPETQGSYERIVGDKGVFLLDTVTGATLAVPNAPSLPNGYRHELRTFHGLSRRTLESTVLSCGRIW